MFSHNKRRLHHHIGLHVRIYVWGVLSVLGLPDCGELYNFVNEPLYLLQEGVVQCQRGGAIKFHGLVCVCIIYDYSPFFSFYKVFFAFLWHFYTFFRRRSRSYFLEYRQWNSTTQVKNDRSRRCR